MKNVNWSSKKEEPLYNKLVDSIILTDHAKLSAM